MKTNRLILRKVRKNKQQKTAIARRSALAGSIAMLAASVVSLGTARVGHAATYYWDINGAAPGASGTGTATGTWDGANTFWNAAPNGTGALSAWVAGSDIAVFAAGTNATLPYTVTVSGTQQIGGLTFEEGFITLSGGGTLQMSAASNFDVAASLIATVNSVVDDGGSGFNLTKTGAGVLVLGGTNTFSGKTIINAGTLSISADANLGDDPGAPLADSITFSGNGTLQTTSSFALDSDRGITVNGGVTGTVQVAPATTLTYAGIVTGAAGTTFRKTGAGTLALQGDSTAAFLGALNVDGGILSLSGGGRMAGTSGVIIGNRATLTLDNTAANNTDRIAGGITSSGGTLNFTHGGAAATNYAEAAGALTLNAGALTINGNQAAVGQTSAVTLASITRSAGGTLLFSGTGAGVNNRNELLLTSVAGLPASGVLIPWAVVTDVGTGTSFAQHTGAGTTLKRYAGAVNTGLVSTWVAASNARPAADDTLNNAARSVNTITLDSGIDLLGTTLSADRIITMSGAGGGAFLQTGGTSLVTNNGNSEYVFAFGTNEALFHTIGDLTISRGNANNLTGTAGLTKTGPGRLTITASAITGTVRLNQGTYVASGNAAGLGPVGALVDFNGGNLEIANDTNLAVTAAGATAVNADTTITINRLTSGAGVTHTLAGPVTIGSRTLTVAAGANVTTNSNYGLTLSNATGVTLTGSPTFVIDNNGTGAGTLTLASIVSGGNLITKAGTGDLITSGTAAFGAPLVVQAGRIGWSNNTAATSITESNSISGAGGIVKSGLSTVTLTGANSYGGSTTITAGVLQAADGVGLSSGSNLVLNGGVFQSSGAFTRGLGTGAGQVQWAAGANGGFSAQGGALTVTFAGAPNPLVWDSTANFVTGAGTLLFGSTTADNVVTFTHNIDLNNTGGALSRTVSVADNTGSAADRAELSGVLSNSVTAGGVTKIGAGVLRLSGANSFTGPVTVTAGRLEFSTVSNNGGAASNLGQATDNISLGGGVLSFIGGASQSTNRAITLTATSTLDASGTGGATITYTGAISPGITGVTLTGSASSGGFITGGITQTSIAPDLLVSSGIWTISGTPLTIGDDVKSNGVGTVLNLNTTGVLTYFTGTSNFMYIGDGGTINLGADDVSSAALGLEGILPGFETAGAVATFNTNTFDITTPRLDVGQVATGFEGQVTGSGTVTVTVTTAAAGLSLYRGSVSADLAGPGALFKGGLGDVTLSGNNSGLSGTTRIDAGNLILDYTASNTDKLNALSALDMRGGTLTLNGNAGVTTTQTMASFTLASGGANRIDVNSNGFATTLNLGAITRGALANDGTIRFELPLLGAITTTTANTNGILGGYATVTDATGTFFARNDGSNNIVAASTTLQDNMGLWTTGQHVSDVAGLTGTLADCVNLGSVRFNAAGGSVLAIGAGNGLTISSGGILMTTNVTAGPSSITGGVLASGIGELIFIQDSTAQGLTVSSTITDASGVTKAGAGTLTLTGTNNFTGITDLQAGTLVASGGNAIGDTSTVTLANDQVNTLQIATNETIGTLAGGNNATGLTVGNVDIGANTLTINGNVAGTFAGYFTGSGTVVKNGAQNFVYQGENGAAFTGTLRVNAGLLALTGDSSQLTAVTSLIVDGPTSSLRIDNDATAASNGKINNAATVTLINTAGGNGFHYRRTAGTTNGTETVGALTLDAGHNVVTTFSNNGAGALLTFASLAAVNNHATALVHGTLLGASSGERGNIIFTAAPAGGLAAVGGAGAAATTTISIFPYLVGDATDTGLGNSFVRNAGADGLTPLTTAEYITNAAGYNALTGATTNNVRFDTNPGVALTGTPTAINSLVLDGASPITLTGPAGGLEITSGAILSARAAANGINTFTGITTGGSRDYTVYVTDAAGSLLIDSPLTSAVPLVKSGAGTLRLENTGNAFTDVYFNQGAVQVDALNKLGSGALNFFGGTLKFGAAFDPSSKTITLGSGGGTFDTNGFSPTLASAIGNGGAGGFTKAGTGVLTLAGGAAYTGTTSVAAGSIVMAGNQAIGTGNLSITAGAFLNMGLFNASVGSVTTADSATNPLQGTGTLTASGDVILNRGTVALTLAGGMNLIKQTAAQTVTLSATNTYTGFTSVTDGTLSIGSIASAGFNSPIGAPTGENANIRLGNLANTGVLLYTGAAGSSDRGIWLTGTTGGGIIDNDGSGALTLSGEIKGIGAGTKTLTLRGTAGTVGTPNQLSGMICELASVINLVRSEAGVWEISGANAYSGTSSLDAGTTLAGNDSAFGTGTLILNGGNLEDDGTTRTLGNALTISSATSVIGGGSGLTFSGALTSAVGLKKAGAGTMTLSGTTASFTGTTEVREGALVLAGGVNDRLGTASSVVLGDLAASGILQLGNGGGVSNQTIASLATSGTGTTNAVVGGNAVNSTLTINQAGNTTFAGNIGGAGTGNNLNVVKQGAGQLIISGTGSGAWTGTTTVSGGQLLIDSTSAFNASTTSLTVATGAEFALRGTGLLANQVYGFGASAGNKITVGTTAGNAVLGFRIDGAFNTQLNLLTGQTMTVTTGSTFQTAVYVDDAPSAASYILINGADPNSLDAGGGTFDPNPVVFNGGSFSYALTNETGGGTFDRWVLTPTAVPALADVWWKGDLGGIATGVWSAALVGPDTNWDNMQVAGSDAQVPPDSGSIVHFSANGAANFATTLGANLTIQELVFHAGATDISVGGANTLTIGNTVDGAGITMLAGAPTNASFSANVALAQAQSFNIADSGDILTFTGGLSGTGALGINDNGSSTGTMVLGGASGIATYTGATNLVTGRLILQGGATNRLPVTTALTMGNATLGAVLQLGDATNGASNNTIGTLNTGAATTNSIVGGGATASILTVVQGSGGTFNGIIGGGGTNENQVGITKQGSATLVLNGANTYTGATTINNGILQLGAAGSINGTTALTINANVGVTATFDVNGRTAVLGGAITLGGADTAAQANIIDTATGGLLTLGGGLTYDATNNPLGSIIGVNLDAGAATRTITVNDSATAATDLTLNGTLAQSGGNLTLAGAGNAVVNGAWTLSGTNRAITFNSTGTWTINVVTNTTGTGDWNINSGVINATVSNALNAADDIIIDGTGVQDSAIVNISGTAGTLGVHQGDGIFIRNGGRINVSVGNGISLGTNTISIGDTASAGAAGAGRLDLAADISTAGALQLGAAGNQIGNITGTGLITSSSYSLRGGSIASGITLAGTGGITKVGDGTVTFSGLRTTTGDTAIQEGNLILDYTVNTASKIGGVLTLGAANANVTASTALTINANSGGAMTQGVTSTVISNAGDVLVDINDAGSATTLSLGAITRGTVGGTVSFDYSSANAMATTTSPAAGTLGWATVTTGGTTRIGAISGGNIVQAATTSQNNAGLWGANQNIINTAGYGGTLDPNCNTIASLTFDAAAASTVTLGASSVLIVTSGGILVNSGVGANGSTITGGSIFSSTAGSQGELIVHQNNTAGPLTINSRILLSSGITKSGLGTLVLGGANTFVAGSRLTINEGTLQVGGGNAIGDGTIVMIRSGATLDLNNSNEAIGNLGVDTTNLTGGTIDLGSGTLTVNQSAASTFGGIFAGSGTVRKSGAATLSLTGTSTMTGTLRIDQGQVTLSGNVSNLNAVTAIILNGPTSALQNNQDQAAANTRITNTATVLLNNTAGGAGFALSKSASTGNATETVGALTLGAGHNVITATSAVADTVGQTTFASLAAVNNHATALVRGLDLGDSTATQRGQIVFTAAPAGPNVAVGGGGAAGTTTISIFPYLVGDATLAGLGNSFVMNTGATNGLRPLTTAEYVNDSAAPATGTNNVRYTATNAITTPAAINSLVLNSGSAIALTGSAASMEITSGALLAAGAGSHSIGGLTGITTGGGRDYTVYVTAAAGSLTMASPLTSAVPLVKSGAGTLALTNTGNLFTDVYLNQGTLQFDDLDKVNGVTNALRFFGGGVRLAAGFSDDLSTKPWDINTGGGTIDASLVTAGATLANGIDDTTVSAGDTLNILTRTTGATGVIGQLTVQGASTYTGTTIVRNTSIDSGIINSVVLNGAATAINGNLEIGDVTNVDNNFDAVVALGANEQIVNTASLTFRGAAGENAYFKLLGFTETVAGISDTTGFGVIENLENTESGVATDGTLIVNSGADFSYNGALRDRGAGANTTRLGFTKQGGGTHTLSGTGITYTGPTLISGGTLELTDATAFSASSAITNNANLTLNRTTGTQIFANVIAGTGSVTKLGAGTVIFTANNTYSGTTTVATGTLQFNGNRILGTAGGGRITVLSNGTLSLQDGAINTLTLANATIGSNLTLGGGCIGLPSALSLDINASLNTHDQILVGQQLTLNAGGSTVSLNNLAGTILADGTYPLATYLASSPAGLFTFTSGATSQIMGGGKSYTLNTTGTALNLVVGSYASAGSVYFKGSLGNAWNALSLGQSNFVNAPAGLNTFALPTAADDVYVSANSAANLATILGADLSIKGLFFTGTGTPATAGVSVSGNTLTTGIDGITVQAGSGVNAISSNIALGGNQTWTNNSSNGNALNITSALLANNGFNLTLGGTDPMNISSTILPGAGTLTKNGANTVTLSGTNLYTGATNINAGTLVITQGLLTPGGTISMDDGTLLQAAGTISRPIATIGTNNEATIEATGPLILSNSAGAANFAGKLNVGTNVVQIASPVSSEIGEIFMDTGANLSSGQGITMQNYNGGDGTPGITQGLIYMFGDGTIGGVLQGGYMSGDTGLIYSDIPVTLRLTGALKGGWSTINVALDFDGGPGVLDNGYDLQGFSPTFTPSAGNGGNVAAGTQISYNSPAQYIPGAGLASSANAQIVAGSGQHSQRLSYQSKINGVLQPAGVLNFTTTSTYSWAADSTFVPASAYATESFYVARTDGHMWAPWTKTSGIGTNGLYELQPGSLTGFTNLTIADYTGLPVLPAGYQWRAESTNKYARLYIGSIDGVQQGDGIWTNGSADQKWTTNLGPAAGTINWGGGQPSSVGHIATFNNTVTNYAGGVVNVDQPQTIGGISLTNTGGGGYNLSGSAIRLENASTSGFVTDGVSSSRTLTYTDPTINVNSGTHTIANSVVIASGDAGAANGLVVNTAPGSQLTMAGNISAGYSLGNSITKQGAGTLIAGGANSYSGATNVQAGTLNVTGSVSGTTNLNLTGGTMQLSGAGGEQVNNAATLNLAGAELAFNNAANQIETLGNLTLGMNSVLNFGALGTSGFDKFVFGTGSRTGGSLTIQNWEGNANVAGADGVNDRLIFTGNAAAASAFEIAFAGSINFIGYGAGFDTIDLGSTFEVVAVPEPTSTVLLGSIALSALIGYRQRRRSFPRKSAATA